MSRRGSAAWGIGALTSVALNAGGLAALALVLQPEPVADQPLPKSRLTIQTQDVPRVDAPQSDGTGEALDNSPPNSPRAQQGEVKQSRAQPLVLDAPVVGSNAPQAAKLDAAQSKSEALSATTDTASQLIETPRPTPITATPAPKTQAQTAFAPSVQIAAGSVFSASTVLEVTAVPAPLLSAALAAITTLAAEPSPSAILQPNLAPTTSISSVIDETATQLAATLPQSEQQTPLTLPADTQAAAPISSQKQPPLPLPSDNQTAALAWSGDTDDRVAESSLAAIQAFMRQGDINLSDSNIGNVRDGIAGILASVPCARLQTTFIPATGQLELRGHVPEDALRTPLLAALQQQVGEAIPISDQLLILPRPQCGALAGIASVGLPQSTEQLTNPKVIGDDGFARSYTYDDGARLSLELVAPDYDSYVYVDFFTADGNVIHLQPNQIVPLEFAPAKSDLSVGKDRGTAPSLDITISAPFGQEIAAAFASSIPLYEGVRPLQEPAAPYLAFLKQQVTKAHANQPDFKGEWVYFFITTQSQ